MGEEALRHDDVQIALRPRHRDIEQPGLVLDLLTGTNTEIRGDAAVDQIHDKTDVPFLALVLYDLLCRSSLQPRLLSLLRSIMAAMIQKSSRPKISSRSQVH